MMEFSLCDRGIPCVDCDDTECSGRGKKESDCPRYRCFSVEEKKKMGEIPYDCDHCAFIDQYIKSLREVHKGNGKSEQESH